MEMDRAPVQKRTDNITRVALHQKEKEKEEDPKIPGEELWRES